MSHALITFAQGPHTNLTHSHTGCTPIDTLPPCVHVFVHYADCARKFGVLEWYWLMVFERYNKKIKNMVGNSTHPMSSLKHALLRDAGNERTLTLTQHPLTSITRIHTAACYKWWKSAHPLPTMGWKPRIISAGASNTPM